MNNLCFEHDFCVFLEYRICALLNEIKSERLKGFWCDGVIFETMIDEKTALFTAFTGKSGQEKYELFLYLGETSTKLISNSLDIQSCIPETNNAEVFIVDTNKKKLKIFTS